MGGSGSAGTASATRHSRTCQHTIAGASGLAMPCISDLFATYCTATSKWELTFRYDQQASSLWPGIFTEHMCVRKTTAISSG